MKPARRQLAWKAIKPRRSAFLRGLFSLHKKSPKMDDYHLKLPLVPRAGLEPARAIAHQILSLARLPIPPPRHKRTLQATV